MFLEEATEKLEIFFDPGLATLPVFGGEDPEGEVRDFKPKAMVD